MAAETVAPRLDRDPAGAAPYDPSIDPRIKALLDQQADIQARLAALLPQKYGPNLAIELDGLRHKLRVLRVYADENRKLFLPYFLLTLSRTVTPQTLFSLSVFLRTVPVLACRPPDADGRRTRSLRQDTSPVRDRGSPVPPVPVRVYRDGMYRQR